MSEKFQDVIDRLISFWAQENVRQACFFSEEYANLIGQRMYAAYKYKGNLKTFVNQFGEREVDLRDRPGVFARLQEGLYFRGAAEYWFGPAFFELVPKERILAFPKAICNEELRPNLVYVKLFDTVFAGLKPEEVALHQAFRDYLGVDQFLMG